MLHINRLGAALAALLCISSSTLAAAPAVPNHTSAPRYQLVDIGTFGGPSGLFSSPGSRILNRHGATVGLNSTTAPDRFAPNCFYDCNVDHAFVWKHGVTTDLGALWGDVSSEAVWINDRGLIAGVSQNGAIDPLTGFPESHGVLWRHRRITDLGTLGGNQSVAYAINQRGQIVGSSLNSRLDPFVNGVQKGCLWLPTTGSSCAATDFAFNALFAPAATQTHATLWFEGRLRDLGTLGGPDSAAVLINNRGQVAGWSYTSYRTNANGVPNTHPFLWENGMMTDLGSLGGSVGAPAFMNERGQVTGASNLAGDKIVHPFLWSRATGMRDLGSLGGSYGHPNWINEAGDVVGISSTADSLLRAFYWHDGHMVNLGTLGTDPSSLADGINNRGQIVGISYGDSDQRGFVSDRGGPIIDLNTLIRPGSKLHILDALSINDRGEIVGTALLPNGDVHPIVLLPYDADHDDAADSTDESD